ncbi:MAG: protein TolR [Hyphomicrobiales bacterium]
MAAGMGHLKGRHGRHRARPRYAPMAEINVTPFVDVMLVLLIIFMVAAPLLTSGVAVDLPQTDAGVLSGDKEPLTISVDSAGKVFLQDRPIDLATLVPKLLAITDNGYDERIYVRGDRAVDYGRVMEVMGTMNAAGFRKVALVSVPADSKHSAEKR